MQPNTQRPVMDVKFPNRAAAAAPTGRPVAPAIETAAPTPVAQATQSTQMTVHEPPKIQGDAAPVAAKPAKSEQKPDAKSLPAEDETPQPAPNVHLKPGAPQGSRPTGVIVATIFVMVVLIGVTIMAYISSNS